jgi:hypothetical protein
MNGRCAKCSAWLVAERVGDGKVVPRLGVNPLIVQTSAGPMLFCSEGCRLVWFERWGQRS